MDEQLWQAFETINSRRRATKYFTGEPIPDEDMKAILAAAQLAPSSFNIQPYELHWIKDKSICEQMRAGCKNQRSAVSASAFVVVVAKRRGLANHYRLFIDYVENSGLYNEKAKAYYRNKKKEIVWFTRLTPLWIFSVLKSILTIFTRHFILMPLGASGLYHWATKSSIFAAQTLMLAAQARGIDTCPMEGFNPFKVAKILNLKQGIIPVVIALGKRNTDKPLTPHWRLPLDKVVTVH
ncbi:nitroreductase family protein [Pedobacter sp. BS3]|uniref:nitroreductase family protein n=1 Tax=Pedobacter sp. BS3 TaxID=2567937 RepID=UPI0011ED34BD|nr:nitroreductase family protein [Pedobacter sp. BS3]TZF82599.1 nitroreductase family protein [Pedobacter sp. BS3]